MHRLKLLIFVFGIIWSGLTYAEDEDRKELGLKEGMVLVEPGIIATSEIQEEYALLAYRERRPKWGSTYSLGYSSYEPYNYEPDFVAADFFDVYKTPDVPLLEFQITIKRNLKIGSLGAELSVGMYQNNSDDTDLSDSSLMLIPVRLGAILALDTLMPEPYVVPYVGGGMYTMIFREELTGGSSNNGNTEAAFYFHAGAQFQIDWLDREGSRLAFQESGVESTFIYGEMQSFLASANTADGDFSNDISYAGGLRVEF